MEGKLSRYLPLEGTGWCSWLLVSAVYLILLRKCLSQVEGITPSSLEEGKFAQVLQAPGSHNARMASSAALALVFVFPLLWVHVQVHQGFPAMNHTANKGYLTLKETSFTREVLDLRHYNLLPIK